MQLKGQSLPPIISTWPRSHLTQWTLWITFAQKRLIIKTSFPFKHGLLTGDGELYLSLYTLTLPIHSFPGLWYVHKEWMILGGSASATLALVSPLCHCKDKGWPNWKRPFCLGLISKWKLQRGCAQTTPAILSYWKCRQWLNLVKFSYSYLTYT